MRDEGYSLLVYTNSVSCWHFPLKELWLSSHQESVIVHLNVLLLVCKYCHFYARSLVLFCRLCSIDMYICKPWRLSKHWPEQTQEMFRKNLINTIFLSEKLVAYETKISIKMTLLRIFMEFKSTYAFHFSHMYPNTSKL